MKKAGVFVAIFTPTACSVLKKKNVWTLNYWCGH